MINKWVLIPVKGANKNGIAFHTCCSVFLPERNKIVLNKPLEAIDDNTNKRVFKNQQLLLIYFSLKNNKIQNEGVYFFGGKNGTYFSNELSILLIGNKH